MRKQTTPKNDLTGKIFEYLTVIEMTRSQNPKIRGYVAKVQCKCGKIKLVAVRHLLLNKTTSCGCRRDQYIKNTGKNNSTYTGYEEIRGGWWKKIQLGAKRRGHKWNLTIEEAWEKFQLQNKKCALTGLHLSFGRADKRKEHTASIDRIDNSKNYSIDNVQWVHKDINLMRNKLSIEYFKEMCKLVSEATIQ